MASDVKEIMDFLRSLRGNNNRIWLNEHKDIYLAARQKVETLTESLIAGVAMFEPAAARLRPSDCLYRIYRDTRFSPDKTPYKTHIGIYINPPGGKKAPTCGYYLHLEPGQTLVAGGSWCPPAPQLKAIRQDIYDNVEEYLEIIGNPEFTRYYATVGDNPLKTAPKGFPREWEHIDLLKPRDYTAYSPLTDADAESADFKQKVLARMKAVQPLNRFLNYSLLQEP